MTRAGAGERRARLAELIAAQRDRNTGILASYRCEPPCPDCYFRSRIARLRLTEDAALLPISAVCGQRVIDALRRRDAGSA